MEYVGMVAYVVAYKDIKSPYRLKGIRWYQKEVLHMSEDMRCETNYMNDEGFIHWNKLNCKKLVYNKKLSRKFRLYLSDKGAYKKAFDVIAKKRYINH